MLDRELPVHHFNIAPEGITSPGKFIGNVASRLVERYGLTCPSLPSDFDTSGVLLRQLLDQAAPRTRADNPLVIAIDALDEVDATLLPPGANHLFLPTALPAHVYVVATCRSGARVHLEVAVAESFAIEVHSDAHQRDVREYLEAQLEVAAIRRWMAGHNVTESEFVQRLLEKSEGNFMYLHYVLPALQHDGTIEGALADLPQGLLDYYRRHWSTMRSRCREEFECVYRPVLCVLAAFGDSSA